MSPTEASQAQARTSQTNQSLWKADGTPLRGTAKLWGVPVDKPDEVHAAVKNVSDTFKIAQLGYFPKNIMNLITNQSFYYWKNFFFFVNVKYLYMRNKIRVFGYIFFYILNGVYLNFISHFFEIMYHIYYYKIAFFSTTSFGYYP